MYPTFDPRRAANNSTLVDFSGERKQEAQSRRDFFHDCARINK